MPRPAVPTRRSDILRAARLAFGARGFPATRMEDIARHAGISKAALYLQFASKEELFEAATAEVIETMLPEMAPATLDGLPAEPLLRGLIAAATMRLTQDDMIFVPRVIIGEGMNFPALARFYYEQVVSRGISVIERIIRHGIERGEFASDDVAQACRTVIGGILVGAIWKRVFEPVGAEVLDPPAMALAHAETVLSGLLTRKQSAA